MSNASLPDWVKRNPVAHINRLQGEALMLHSQFPHIGIYNDGETLYLEGPVISMSNNMYLLRVVYPSEYPYKKPEAFVRDSDVINFCKNKGYHDFHHQGYSEIHGLNLCVMGSTDNVNKGWTPNQTGITILEYAIMWLHGYEVKKVSGKWPLPE
jgi:hypothetical protein